MSRTASQLMSVEEFFAWQQGQEERSSGDGLREQANRKS